MTRLSAGAAIGLMFGYEEGEHSCSCAVLGTNAPCGHCTSCPVCNCPRCEDWHQTSDGETCPKLDPTQEEGHTMPNANTATIRQYGLRYPDGTTKWATGASNLKQDGEVLVPAEAKEVSPDTTGHGLSLTDVLAAGANLSHITGRLRKIAEEAHTDPDAYVAGVKIVSRSVMVIVMEEEVHRLPGTEEENPF